jgi:hypothetical protein
MNFTPKSHVRSVVSGILTIAVMGLIGWLNHVAPGPASISATNNALTVQKLLQTSNPVRIVPAVEFAASPGLQIASPEHYQTVSWLKNKNWWKRNAPIIGGAGGGALIGGLAGGGKGALIGGAVGGGGGYLYKHFRNHHQDHHNYNQQYYNNNQNYNNQNYNHQYHHR